MTTDKKTQPPRLYLAGPMTNIADLNFPIFHAEAFRLRALGYEIVNPAEINGGADELTATASMTPAQLARHWLTCMRADVKQLVDCDGIALLPGWKLSRGARIECELARGLGLLVCNAADLINPATFISTAHAFLNWSASQPIPGTQQSLTASEAVPELSDEGIVKVLASFGIDSTESKYGFDALQVATTVPSIRRVVETYLAAAPLPQVQSHALTDEDAYAQCGYKHFMNFNTFKAFRANQQVVKPAEAA